MRDPSCIPTLEDDCYDYHQDDQGNLIDPECAPEEEISEWLEDKTLFSKVMKPSIDFDIDNKPMRQNEKWLTSIALKDGGFTDIGYRFRLNKFSM